MDIKSPFPDVQIPDVDLWTFLFERQDRKYSDHKVLFTDVDTGRNYTFKDMRTLALNFGHSLRQQWNWQPGDVLAVFASNSIDLPPIIWGALAVGGVVCPINPNYKVDELLHPLRDSQSKAIVTGKAQLPTVLQAAERAGISNDRVIVVDEADRIGFWESDPAVIGDVFDGPFTPPIRDPASELAYLVYSSGTTGLPKAVMLSHRNMVGSLLQLEPVEDGQLGFTRGLAGEGDRGLAFLPFFHIYGITFILNDTVHLGLSTFIMPRFSLEKFCSTVQKHQVTYVWTVPPVVLELVQNNKTSEYDLTSIRMAISGAAPLAAELIHALYDKLKIPIRQGYGMTECSPCTHMQTWDEARTHIGSVGRLLPNMTARFTPIDDEQDERSGELWVKEPNVFPGYLGNASANADAFSEDGFYKTGDVGYQDENGYLYITDRVKELIKYNGFQVAPVELEGIIIAHPAVSDVAVVGLPSGQDGSELPRAYVVPVGKCEDEAMAESIINYVADRAVGYKKLRGGVCFVQDIPRNPTGKILRRKLKQMS
ncbi:hypothetical protein ASPWEDRAFT_32322 [Aspergillus wentii DTO 134E9]|uniref:AMP-dependent synthetase/ligase domain-containing protein n=1 Tax=Aspergillus wentii DTO 134E9 TaxID=1073089 RepID=A0A1L9R596_ASPWE|nr:uncharacterized protein ASPWEDRAFT_32322 [Aspergillus wentii DTO 134E9]KAI9923745.1 hypothetical protein MW887_008372 [Aspergillus wentii]OJJ30096.1 hypothetical protein ASPWEDRAFT_32322 [Aspergillus wentii DTO 134E9]